MRLLAVSPHLDDAAFSAGGTLARRAAQGWEVTIATCFTGTVVGPRGFALACQLDKGLSAEVDYMALRRREDLDACAALGAHAVHLPFLEAPHRGYASAAELFAGRRDDDGMVARLVPALRDLLTEHDPDIVLGPLCLGDHVDHHVVRDALARAAGSRPILSWEDWPYVDRVANLAPPTMVVRLDEHGRAARLAACLSYQTQIGFQFGGAAALRNRLGQIDVERFHAADPPDREASTPTAGKR